MQHSGLPAPVPHKFIRQVLAHYARPVTWKGVALAAMDFTNYGICLAAVLWLPDTWEKIVASLVLSLAIANLFALGHEAAHGAIVRQRWLNRLIAVLCFGPALVNYRMWLYDHNTVHHVEANAREGRNSWSPLSKVEFDALPWHRQLLQRAYRAPFGLGFGLGYFLERWLHVDLAPNRLMPASLRPAAWRHFTGLVAYVVLFVAFLGIVAPRVAPIGSLEAVLLGFVLPFALWMTTFGFTVFIHHTHPDVPWIENEQKTQRLTASTTSTRWLFPSWFTFLTHNVFDHSVHHWNPRVPCYNATRASERLQELCGGQLITVHFSFKYLNEVLRRCKLYDYENHRWLDFDGVPTSTPRTGISESREAASAHMVEALRA